MVERVIISAFKRVEHLELPLSAPATVLLGGNNSGKSSVLEAIHLAVAAAQAVERAGSHDWADEKLEVLVPQERLTSARVNVQGSVRNGRDRAAVTIRADGLECTVSVAPREGSVQIGISGAIVGEQVMASDPPFCIYVPGLAGIQLREPAMAVGVVRRAIARGDSNLVLRNVLYLLWQQSAAWAAFLEDFRDVFPDAEFQFRYEPGTDDVIDVWFKHENGDFLPLANAGTGVLQCIQLLAYARLYRPRMLLLDEPDAHLHARNQRRMCRVLLTMVEERQVGQVLVATHSRHLVSALQRNAQLCWLRSGELLPADPPDLIAGLLELGALDDGEKLAGRTLKCVVLTEDEDQAVIEPVLWSSGFVEDETLVLSYRGCTNHVAVAALCQTFADRLPGARVVVHRDRDYNDPAEVKKIEQELEAAHAVPFVTDGVDVEAYYLRAPYLVELGVTRDDAEALIADAERRAKPDSLRKMISGRFNLAADRRRRDRKAPVPDAGQIAADCQAELEAGPQVLRHGKETLRRLRELLQDRGINPNPFFKKSDALRVERLTELAQTLWPPPPGDADERERA